MTREEFSTVQPGDRLVTATPEILENKGAVVDTWDEAARCCLGERIAVVTDIISNYNGWYRVHIDLDNGCDEFEDSGAPIDILM